MKPDPGSCIYGAGVILRHVRSLEAEFSGVHQGDADIEYIHRMRVASRRLRATLPLFEACQPRKKFLRWRKEIRLVTRALGAARDADVQMDALTRFKQKQKDPGLHPGLNRLLLRLRQSRERLQPGLTAALDELNRSGVIQEMRDHLEPLAARAEGVYIYTPALYQHAYTHITSRLDQFLAYDEIVDLPEKVSELHEMRISAKWLRYTMETFAPLYPAQLKEWLQDVRDAQEILGDIHDCDVWKQFIPEFLEAEFERIMEYHGNRGPYPLLLPGIEAFAADRLSRREAEYTDFTQKWAQWREEEIWSGLRSALQVPGPAAAPTA